jgi:hypothetical protein
MSISDLVVVLYFSFQFVQYKCRIKIQQTVDYMFAYRERERGKVVGVATSKKVCHCSASCRIEDTLLFA